jgi:hypothetical protein
MERHLLRSLAITKCAGPQSSERQWVGLAIYPVSRQLVRGLLNELRLTFPTRFHLIGVRQGMTGTSPWAIMDHSSKTTLAGIVASPTM